MARLLFVEDHPDVHDFICELLKEHGHETDCVWTKTDAEEALRTNEYDLVISNMGLPDGSGYDVAMAARERGTYTLLITGDPAESEKLAGSGFECLPKPFLAPELIRIVEHHLRSRALAR